MLSLGCNNLIVLVGKLKITELVTLYFISFRIINETLDK